jgi:hypothetical protein
MEATPDPLLVLPLPLLLLLLYLKPLHSRPDLSLLKAPKNCVPEAGENRARVVIQ